MGELDTRVFVLAHVKSHIFSSTKLVIPNIPNTEKQVYEIPIKIPPGRFSTTNFTTLSPKTIDILTLSQLWGDEISWDVEIWEVYIPILIPTLKNKKGLK